MRLPRIKFSVRSLLIVVSIVAAGVAVSLQFGPHIIWRTVDSDIATGVFAIPSRPLIAAQPDESLAVCRVGPVSCILPKSLAIDVELKSGIGGVFLVWRDNDRSFVMQLPQPEEALLLPELREYPGKAEQTFPRLFNEIAVAQSSDFSFGMSHRELRWHTWLLSNRAIVGSDIDSIEYLWKPELEGNLVARQSKYTFQWATTDNEWQGTMVFVAASPNDVGWIRQVCATFTIDGDPAVLQNLDDAAIQSLIKITDSEFTKR